LKTLTRYVLQHQGLVFSRDQPQGLPMQTDKRFEMRLLRRRVLARAMPLATAVLIAALPAMAATAADAPAYRLDAGHTSVYWEVLHMGTSSIQGRFDKHDGSARFDAQRQLLEVAITVDVSSVSTGMPAFDKIIRGTTLLAADEYPQAWFVARTSKFDGPVPKEITGELTLRGISQGITLNNTRWKCGFNILFRREVCGGNFEARLSRNSFGLTLANGLVDDTVVLRIQVEGIRDGDSTNAPTPARQP
jgi:polyisoprenoid-binding protein YceI